MLKQIKKDYYLILSLKGTIAIAMILVPICIYIIGSINQSGIYATSVFVAILLTYSMVGYVQSQQILSHSMPFSKLDVVLSKYIIVFLNYIIVNSYIFFIVWIIRKLPGNNIQYLSLELYKYMLFVSIISLSFVIPALLSYTPSWGNFISIFIFSVIFNFSNNYLLDPGTTVKVNLNNLSIVNNLWFNIAVVILMAISIAISLYGYKNKQFY